MTVAQQIAHFGDVPITLDIELGRTIMTMREVLRVEIGSAIKFSRSAGDNIDVFVGGTLVGSGEIVIIEDNIGVRITDFSSEE
jgi:flagellar motor switch protein FliN/FliY